MAIALLLAGCESEGTATSPRYSSPTLEVGDSYEILSGSITLSVTAAEITDHFGDCSEGAPPSGCEYPDRPKLHFLALQVQYEAREDGVLVNPADWYLGWTGSAGNPYTFVRHGPEPPLWPAELTKGVTHSGWLVYEVDPEGSGYLYFRGAHLLRVGLGNAAFFRVRLPDG